jgi:hypothetical protein
MAGFVLLAVLAAGCAAPRAGLLLPDGSVTHDIYARVEFIDEERNPVPVQSPLREMRLLFSSIPGQIDGPVRSEPLQSIRVINVPHFRLDVGGMTEKLREIATPFVSTTLTRGLSMTPPSTRFVRIATLAVDPGTGRSIGGAGFLDPASRDYLILVYVDRPCSLTGTMRINDLRIDHDVRLTRAGFHWLRYHRPEEGRLVLNEHTGGDVVYTIEVAAP